MLFRSRVQKIIDKVVRSLGIKGDYEVNVYSASREEMMVLGEKWMGDGEEHEVLSWPLENTGSDPDGVWRLGEIVVRGSLPQEKLEFLIEHGCRHLLGIHHN